MSERLFYIWSLTHTKGEMTLWWMPDDRGYTTNLARAGKYTEAQIAANRRYYDNGRSTRAVPVETADAMSMRDRLDGLIFVYRAGFTPL